MNKIILIENKKSEKTNRINKNDNSSISEKYKCPQHQKNIINQLYLSNLSNLSNEVKICKSEINKKLNSYKQQDIKKNKFNYEKFITIEEMIETMVVSKLKCYYCRCDLYIFYNKVRQDNQWTLDRDDNSVGHNSNNVFIACLKCNLERRKKTAEGFKFYKQLRIVKKD